VPRATQGSVFRAGRGWGIRWPENGARHQKTGFRTRTEARAWWDEHVRPRLRRGLPSADVTLADFTSLYLERWGPTVAPRTSSTLRRWLAPALRQFGGFTLAELEGAAADIARWRAQLPSDDQRHKATRALRQTLAAAQRWGFITVNPALAAGPNPAPRSAEIRPFTRDELRRILLELGGQDRALVLFAAETGLRTNEWCAVERRDVDWRDPAVTVARRYASGRLTGYPKTVRRRVPLTPVALDALRGLPPRLDSQLLFPSPGGGHLRLDNWAMRVWRPALDAAGVQRRGPYHLRHTFATEALAAGVSIFELARLMGSSVETIDRHYAGFVRESEGRLRDLLAARHHHESSATNRSL